jgi:RNA polymerase sigma factor (sigma-70 family)
MRRTAPPQVDEEALVVRGGERMISIAAQASTESAPERARRKVLLPSVARPTAQQLARLDDEDRSLLGRLLSEPFEYVDHESFHAPDAEQVFSGTADPPPVETPGVETDSGRTLTPLLTPEEEDRLFREFNYARMRQMSLLRACRGHGLAGAQIEELLAWARRAAAARCRIVESNMPLVLAMARRTRPASLDLSELVSEGNFALLRSVDKFDCSRGFKFSTYACRAILKSFSRVMMRNGRYRSRFPVEFEPSLERSDHLDRQRERQQGDAMRQITTILAENRAALNAMEQQVIRERFALNNANPETTKTLEEVGEMIGVTKERVRQIQNRALRKLRCALEDVL